MSTTQTLREPKRKRRRSNAISQNIVEAEETLTPRERYERWRRNADERERQRGQPEEPPLTMEEIVAIVKETRAEIYAEQQKNSTCS